MAKNSAVDDVLSMISSDDEGTNNRAPSSQQSLRDRMLNESKAEAARQQQYAQREEDLSEEIIEEEEEEEYGTEARKSKLPFIIGGLVLALIAIIIIVMFFTGGEEEEVVEEPPTEEIVIEPEPEVVVNEPVALVTYDFEQVQNLLAAGATQEQVDMWQENGTSYNYVYFTMLDRYYGWQLSNQLPTYDLAGEAYKEVINQTWMSLPKRTDIVEWTEDNLAYEHSVTQNLDYEKVEPYGNQLFLKVYLDADTHDSWFFLNITPYEWNLLDDEGNVVVDYVYQTHWLPHESIIDQEEDEENIFIVSATLDIIESTKSINERKAEQSSSSIIDGQ